MSTELVEFEQAVTAVEPVDLTRPIEDEETLARASAEWKVVREARLAAEKKLKAKLEPLKKATKDWKELFDPWITRVKFREGALNEAILGYRARVDAEQQAVQAQLDEQHQEVVAEAQARGVPEELLPLAPVAPRMPTAIETAAGTVRTRMHPKWRVTDESQVPLEIVFEGQVERLWLLNEGLIGRIRRAAGDAPSPIPGVEFYFEEGLSR